MVRIAKDRSPLGRRSKVDQEKNGAITSPLTEIRHRDEERTGNGLYKEKED